LCSYIIITLYFSDKILSTLVNLGNPLLKPLPFKGRAL
jgi:hypothetical protein